METKLKTFWSVLFAILAAAIVIWAVIGVGNSLESLHRQQAYAAALRAEANAIQQQTNEINRQREELWQSTMPDASPTPRPKKVSKSIKKQHFDCQ